MQRTLERRPTNRRKAAATCAVVVVGLLGVGWWPFTVNPPNQVYWTTGQNGLTFAGTGIAYEDRPSRALARPVGSGFTVELFLQSDEPRTRDGIARILTVEDVRRGTSFTIGQWKSQLLISLSTQNTADSREISIDALQDPRARVVIVSGGDSGATIYLDGQPPKRKAEFVLDRQALDGRLVLGDAPNGRHSWNGRLLGLALMRRAIDSGEARAHQVAWTTGHLSQLEVDPELDALYLFDERSGDVAKDRSTARRNLTIPKGYSVLRKTFLVLPEARWPRSGPELEDVVVNLLGFAPMGFLFFRYRQLVSSSTVLRSIISTTLTGAGLSLFIETGQVWLPARNSSITDVALNTAGMLLGACLGAGAAAKRKPY